MSDIQYHTKYIKYKTKYYQLKNDIYNMTGGAAIPVGFLDDKLIVPNVKCKGSAAQFGPNITDPRLILGDTKGCPDPSDTHFCAKKTTNDLSCVKMCQASSDCTNPDLSDCSGGLCVPKNTNNIESPVISEIDLKKKIASQTLSFKKSEIDTELREAKEETDKANKEAAMELQLAFEEAMETAKRRRGIRTKQRKELLDVVAKEKNLLKRDHQKQEQALKKKFRAALADNDANKKNSIVKMMEEQNDRQREERVRFKERAIKRNDFLKNKQYEEKVRNNALDELNTLQKEQMEKLAISQREEIDAIGKIIKKFDNDKIEARTDLEKEKIAKQIDAQRLALKTKKRQHDDIRYTIKETSAKSLQALKAQHQTEVNAAATLEGVFNSTIEKEIKFYEGQKKIIDESNNKILAMYDQGGLSGLMKYSYISQFGGAVASPWNDLSDKNCDKNKSAAGTDGKGRAAIATELKKIAKGQAVTAGFDISGCTPPGPARKEFNINIERSKLGYLVGEMAKEETTEQKSWRDKVKKADDDAQAAGVQAAKDAATAKKTAETERDKAMEEAAAAALKSEAEAAKLSAPDCKEAKDNAPECVELAKENVFLTGKCVKVEADLLCETKNADDMKKEREEAEKKKEEAENKGGKKYYSIDFNINDYLIDSEI